jgi:hypothetical protein
MVYILNRRIVRGWAGRPRRTAMSLMFESIFIALTMLVAFLLAFVMMFLLAMFLSPIERGLSKIIWDYTSSRGPATPGQKGKNYRDFSKKHF